jgi:hypothetical protein
MSAKSAVKSAALICGTAADVFDVVEDGVVDELHAETTSPNESTAPVIAMDLRPVPIVFPSVDNAPSTAHGRIALILALNGSRTGPRYQTVMSKRRFEKIRDFLAMQSLRPRTLGFDPNH